jgi:hypothetical protein
MVWNGNDAVSIDLGNVEAGATKYVNVIGALKAAGELPPFGRADIVFTANAPAGYYVHCGLQHSRRPYELIRTAAGYDRYYF